MEGNGTVVLAVVTQDLHCSVLVLWGHGGLGNLLIPLLPVLLHIPHGVHAQGTAVRSSFAHFLKAGFVQQVTAGQDVGADPGRVDVLHTHRTILPGHVLHTLVIPLQITD